MIEGHLSAVRKLLSIRAAAAGIAIDASVVSALEVYYGLLSHWNKRINLTALPLEMPTEPGKGRPARRRPPAKPKEDGFVVFVVDGFAQLTPEQRTWPVVSFWPGVPPADPPPSDAGGQPEKT